MCVCACLLYVCVVLCLYMLLCVVFVCMTATPVASIAMVSRT